MRVGAHHWRGRCAALDIHEAANRWLRTCRRDVMPKEGNAGFEIPADMLALAEKSVEQAKQAFDVFISAAQHAVSTAEKLGCERTSRRQGGRRACDGFRRTEHHF